MKRLHQVRIVGPAVVGACLWVVVSAAVGAQPRLSTEEAMQMYAAAGFRVVNDQPLNRCGKPAKPRVTFADINADKLPEAIFVDADPSCYGFSQRYFAVLVKDGGTWRQLFHGNGIVQALKSRTSSGWLDLRVTDAGCARDYRYDGKAYQAITACAAPATQPTPSPQSSSAPTSGTQSPQPSSAEKPPAAK